LFKGSFGNWKASSLTGVPQSGEVNPGLGNSDQLSNSPIVPETNGTWKVFAAGIVLVIVAGALYFFLR
jgi:hypothetical protein